MAPDVGLRQRDRRSIDIDQLTERLQQTDGLARLFLARPLETVKRLTTSPDAPKIRNHLPAAPRMCILAVALTVFVVTSRPTIFSSLTHHLAVSAFLPMPQIRLPADHSAAL